MAERGCLTIFTGYYSGCGKTTAMLEAAKAAHDRGVDVAIGLLEEMPIQAKMFDVLPVLEVQEDGQTIAEIDIEACLIRRPTLILIDTLSHLNVEGARHRKRYQDVEELLQAGIDVYTTLDIQHIESLQEAVVALCGQAEKERIPDSIFDRADRVQLIDCDPRMLAERLAVRGETADLEILCGLRELALRRAADRAALYCKQKTQKWAGDRHEHILVCLSPAPSNERIIRMAARMANAFQCDFTALYVETKHDGRMSSVDKEALVQHRRLAEQLGATVETTYGDDVAYQIAEFVRLCGVTKIVMGRSGVSRHGYFLRASLTERLLTLVPELDIHIIPDNSVNRSYNKRHWEPFNAPVLSLMDLLKSVGILIAATLIGLLFYHWGFTEANIITLYIVGGMLISVVTKSPLCSLIVSIVSVLTFNFFFTVPRFSLEAYDSGYPVTFLIMFLASLLTGSLATRLKFHATHSARVAWRTKMLFETNQHLQKAHNQADILAISAQQLHKILARDIIVYAATEDGLHEAQLLLNHTTADASCYRNKSEQAVAKWTFINNKRAGAGTDTLSDARCTYLAIRSGNEVYGVVGVAVADQPLDPHESDILLSILGECALALENEKNLEEKEAAAVLAKNEQLRANLLRSISHDLRTPLTAISGNASNLLSNGEAFDCDTKKRMVTDIYDDAVWLINLVENLLSVSRLEEGRMNLHLSAELIDEVVAEALRHINRKSVDYHIHVQDNDEFLLAQMDAKLIVQVIINIVDNAIKYTPPGSTIDISWQQHGAMLECAIADNGPGIPDCAKPRIFDMFYSATNEIVDSRRSMGLGLALCKSIINAHGGELTVRDNVPHGAIFTFSVPAWEVEIHE